MNLLHNIRVYDILWALERVIEIDSLLFNKDTKRHRLYRGLSLLVLRLLIRYQEERERERQLLGSYFNTQILVCDSDEEVPDLVPNDSN